MKLILLTIFTILIFAISGFGQTYPCQKKVEGKDFWFGFMEAPYNSSVPIIGIDVSSNYDFTFSCYIGNQLIYKNSVPKNYTCFIQAQISQMGQAHGSEKFPYEKKGIHIVSDQPISVIAYNYFDAASIYPSEYLGTEYYTMCATPFYSKANPYGYDSKNSEFLVVATQDATKITIIPSVVTDGGKPAHTPFDIVLNSGEVYQVQSANLPNLPGQGDLTGSYIKSDKPIAVFSGNYGTSIPTGTAITNHFYEQMPPLNLWGTKFITISNTGQTDGFFRAVALEDNTLVHNGFGRFLLPKKGDYRDFQGSDPEMVISDKPILLAQYGGSPYGFDAPYMMIVKPVDQIVNKAIFSITFTKKFIVTVITENQAVGSIKVADVLLSPNSFSPIGQTGYSFAQIEYTGATSNSIESIDQGKGFIAYAQGIGPFASQGYTIGFPEGKDISLDLGGTKDANNNKIMVLCEGADPLTLDAEKDFSSYAWSTGETTRSISVTKEGTYTLTATTSEGCILKDSVKVVLSKPGINLGKDILECDNKPVALDANLNNQFSSYLWSTPQGSLTDPKITASQSGTYSVTATTSDGCKAKDTINVTIGTKPKLNFSNLDTLICGRKSALLDISADKGSYTLQRQDNGFIFNSLQAIVPDWGKYPFKFTATDASGCSSDTTFKIGFHKIPAVDFSIDSTKCYHYNLEVKYIGDASVNRAGFTWVFGGDTIANGSGINSYTIPLGINKSKRDLSLKVAEDGCWNADTIKDIKVIPDLEMKVVNKLGCEPYNAEFIAKNTETVTYDWNFGEGALTRLDNHPFHLYQNSGYYDVFLKVTTTKGCTNSVSVDSMVHVAPVPTVGFSLDPSKCLDLSDHQISYVGSGNQKDSYNWDLSGFDPEEIIQNPGLTNGPFIFNLKNKPQSSVGLRVISQYGCKSEIGSSIVKRVPLFSMGVADSTGCVPLETEFDGIIGDKVDQVSYSWDFGDGTMGTGEKVSHIYNDPGSKYTVTLQAFSAITGCSDIIKKIDLVHPHPNPGADFSMDHPIVYNDKPDVKFENLSTGALNYIWDFGDGSTSTDVNALHKYQVMGYQKVLLQSFNEFMCSDTTSHTVIVGTAHIFPPNAFSPNAPNPVDREFKLNQETIKEEGYHLVILSRWNDIVFETKNEIRGWDGRMRNGDFAHSGNYIWILEFTDFLDRKHRQTGTVTLIY